MRYIKKVILENFQSHKYSEIDFGPDLNVIVGPSDSGKSAIIRALKWVMYNEPAGDFFIREGERECGVSLVLSDDTVVKRYRTRSKNGYLLLDNMGNESVFEGIGSNVPQEVIDVIGIRKMQLDGDSSSSINLGEQLEGPFLLTEKSSTRANAIGRLVGVDIVDDALREVLRDMRSLSLDKKIKEETLLKISEQLKEYRYLETLKDTHTSVKELFNSSSKMKKRMDSLEELGGIYEKVKSSADVIDTTLKKLEVLKTIDKTSSQIEQLLNTHKQLEKHSLSLNNIMTEQRSIYSIIEQLSNLEIAAPLIQSTEFKYIEFTTLDKLLKKRYRNQEELKELSVFTAKLEKIDRSKQLLESAEHKTSIYNNLVPLSQKYTSVFGSIRIGTDFINKLKPYTGITNTIDSALEKESRLSKLNKLYANLETIRQGKKTATKQEADSEKSINSLTEQYISILKEVEKCPFCLSNISDNKIDHIISHHIQGR